LKCTEVAAAEATDAVIASSAITDVVIDGDQGPRGEEVAADIADVGITDKVITESSLSV
jgi:hypothetical protein